MNDVNMYTVQHNRVTDESFHSSSAEQSEAKQTQFQLANTYVERSERWVSDSGWSCAVNYEEREQYIRIIL